MIVAVDSNGSWLGPTTSREKTHCGECRLPTTLVGHMSPRLHNWHRPDSFGTELSFFTCSHFMTGTTRFVSFLCRPACIQDSHNHVDNHTWGRRKWE